MNDGPFANVSRVDARDKVMGKALFSAGDGRPGLVHAALASACSGRGRHMSVDTSAAEAVADVRLVLTHETRFVATRDQVAGPAMLRQACG
jgi:xanthine dehydrogenase YagR molybdenum-binding subunit